MRRLAWLLGLWALAGCDENAKGGGAPPLCSDGSCAACVETRTCPPGESCLEGRCTTDPGGGRDCGVGERFEQARCRPIADFCQRNADCTTGYVCDGETLRCVPDSDPGRACVDFGDCLAGERCVAGFCRVLDAAVSGDARIVDARVPDAAADAQAADASVEDATAGDASEPDGKVVDFAVRDAGPEDAFVPPDTAPVEDAAVDAQPDAVVVVDAAPAPDARPDAAVVDAAPSVDAAPVVDAAPAPDATPDAAADAAPDMAVRIDAAPPLDAFVPPVDMAVDAAPDAQPDVAVDAQPDMAVDAAPDAQPDMMLDAAPDMAIDAAPDAAPPEPDAFVPPPTPPRGLYDYLRWPIGQLLNSVRADFHPDGDYALVLEDYDVVHVVDWQTRARIGDPIDVAPPGRTIRWQEVSFHASGAFALLLGVEDGFGVVYKFDDAAWREGAPLEAVLYPLESTRRGDEVPADLAWPWVGELPVVLSYRDTPGAGYNAYLRELDPWAEAYTAFQTSQFTSAGCLGVAFATNEFGGPAIVVACGVNGSSAYTYTEIGDADGVLDGQGGEWFQLLGNRGNLSSVDAHRSGDYALALQTSGNNPPIYRFELGQMNTSGDAVRLPRNGLYRLVFQQEGQRTLIIGQEGAPDGAGRVIEYRHPLYTCPFVGSPDCAITDVSIGAYDQPPYNGDGHLLADVAWRPGCDGGIIVGGINQVVAGNSGRIIEFQIANGRPCRD